MYGSSQLLITVSPEQFEQILDERLESALRKHFASSPIVPESTLPEMATVNQVCAFLKISRPTLDSMSKDTEDRPALLLKQQVGRRVLYRRQDVIAAMKEIRRFKSSATGSAK